MAIKSMGIVGCGAIGQALVRAVEAGKLAVRIAGVTSRSPDSAREFLAGFRNPPSYLPLSQLIEASDLLVEAAGGHVVVELARSTFAAGKDLVINDHHGSFQKSVFFQNVFPVILFFQLFIL